MNWLIALLALEVFAGIWLAREFSPRNARRYPPWRPTAYPLETPGDHEFVPHPRGTGYCTQPRRDGFPCGHPEEGHRP